MASMTTLTITTTLLLLALSIHPGKHCNSALQWATLNLLAYKSSNQPNKKIINVFPKENWPVKLRW